MNAPCDFEKNDMLIIFLSIYQINIVSILMRIDC